MNGHPAIPSSQPAMIIHTTALAGFNSDHRSVCRCAPASEPSDRTPQSAHPTRSYAAVGLCDENEQGHLQMLIIARCATPRWPPEAPSGRLPHHPFAKNLGAKHHPLVQNLLLPRGNSPVNPTPAITADCHSATHCARLRCGNLCCQVVLSQVWRLR